MRGVHNDYLLLAKNYLRSYQELAEECEGWARDEKDILVELATMPVAISKYGNEPGGGQGELNEVERLAERRMELEAQLSGCRTDMEEARRLFAKVDAAIAALPEEQSMLIRAHYICGATWYELGDSRGYSYSHIRRLGKEALGAFTVVMFGYKSMPSRRVLAIA